MHNIGGTVPRSAFISLLFFGMMSATAWTADLSKYRSFQLGADLPSIAGQVGASPSETRVVYRRPALIQELEWSPQPLGSSSQAESASEVIFSFYNGELFRIAVHYDRYQTEGLTPDDFIEAISTMYGTWEIPALPAGAVQAVYDDQDEILARWQDSRYCFDLIRSSNGPTFKLIGVLKGLQAPAQAAITEAKRLDNQEEPQREAARILAEKKVERAGWNGPGS
jgi:hypothetical protein